jgi:hypothetical protein
VHQQHQSQRPGRAVLGALAVAAGLITACGTSTGATATGTSSSTPAAATTPSGSATAGPENADARYVTYRNARFGFSVAVPTSFTAGAPPEDGDGMAFGPADHRVSLRVYGSNNVNGDTAASAAAAFVARQRGQQCRITLDSVSGDTYTVSGFDATGTTIWYEHLIVESHAEYGIDWQYPAAQAGRFDPDVTNTVHSFDPGPDHAA